MTLTAERIDPPVQDPVSNVLKWVLLVVPNLTFALLAWATTATYRLAPPQPDRFAGADGAWTTPASAAWGPITARITPLLPSGGWVLRHAITASWPGTQTLRAARAGP